LSIPVLSFLTPLEPVAYDHDFLSGESGADILSGDSDFAVVDVNQNLGISPTAESTEQGGAIYAVG
jgi:hypothetical protein